jgi:type I restriction enzyme S subunit
MTGWPTIRLGDLVSIKHGWPFQSEFFSENLTGLPIVVSIGNFQYTGGFRFESTTLKEYRADYPPEYKLKPDDILLVMTCQTAGGEILGIPGKIPLDGRTYLHNQRLGKVVLHDQSRARLDFLYWVLLSPRFNQHLFQGASGTKILHTSPGRIEDYRFTLPSLSEQRAIAGILGALDNKIELDRRMNQTLEAIAQALFRSWFVDFEPVSSNTAECLHEGMDAGTIAGFSRRPKGTETGSIPDGWQWKPLDEIAHFLNGLALQKYPPTEDEFLPVIKIAQLRRGNTEGSDKASTRVPADYIINDGDVLFSWSGTLEVALWTGGRGALNQHLFKVTSTKFPRWFFYFWCKEHLPEFRRIAQAKATTMGHIQRHHLTRALVAVPPPEVLSKADALIAPLLEKQVENNLEIRILSQLRDTLLPKLLSGEIRVKDAEATVGAAL